MKEDEDIWRNFKESALALDQFSFIPDLPKINKLPRFEMKCRLNLSKDSSVDYIVSILKSRFSSSVDLSQVECKDWMKCLPLESTVNSLFVRGQELKTREDVQPLATFAENTKTLEDLHLENNKLEWEALFPFLPILLDEKRRPPLILHLSGNPLVPGKQFNSLSLAPSWKTRPGCLNDIKFQAIPKERIFFASALVHIDLEYKILLENAFSPHKIENWKTETFFTLPVVKVAGGLYFLRDFPHKEYGRTVVMPLSSISSYIKTENRFPSSKVQVIFRDVYPGESEDST